MTEPTPARTASKALLQYSVLRLGLFFVVVVTLSLAGFKGLPALLVSLLVTSFAGFFLLKKQRSTYAVALEARMTEKRQARGDLRSRLDDGEQPQAT